MLKYKADLYYAKRDFVNSSKMYEAMLENNKRPNSSNYRDAAEGLSRCCVNLGEFERGFKITLEMVSK